MKLSLISRQILPRISAIKVFVVIVIWLDLRLSSFKCIDNQRNPFPLILKQGETQQELFLFSGELEPDLPKKKFILKGWKDSLENTTEEKIKHRYMSEEDLTIKTSIQHIRFQWQQQLFVPVCDLSIKFCNLYSVSNRFIYFFDPKLFGDGHIRRLRQLHVHMGYWSQFWSCREHQNVIVASITFIRLIR